MSEAQKLPKQWRHWAQGMRLRAHRAKHSRGDRGADWHYLQGRGRYWRVNCYGMFQCGDTYDEFDRWARCDIKEVEMPISQGQFRYAVLRLLAAKEAA